MTIDLRPETGLGAFTLEHLDFTPELPCEHSQHETLPDRHHGNAWGLVESHPPCRCPSRAGQLAICRPVWEHAGATGLLCPDCGVSGPRAEFWSLVATL